MAYGILVLDQGLNPQPPTVEVQVLTTGLPRKSKKVGFFSHPLNLSWSFQLAVEFGKSDIV